MALGVVAIGVMSYFALHRPAPPGFTAPAAAAASDSASPTASPSTTADPSPSEEASPDGAEKDEVRVLVVGDDFLADSSEVHPPEASWMRLVSAGLASDRRNAGVAVAAADGSGYLATGPKKATFAQLAEHAEDYDVIVFFGSKNDTASAADVQTAARDTFSGVLAASPKAPLLVLGPVWPGGNPPGYILTNRDAAAKAAAEVSATFVDPLNEGLADAPATDADGILTVEGHRQLADLLLPLLVDALSA
jgi:hypothetical protein